MGAGKDDADGVFQAGQLHKPLPQRGGADHQIAVVVLVGTAAFGIRIAVKVELHLRVGVHEAAEKPGRQFLQQPHKVADPQVGPFLRGAQLAQDIVVLLQIQPGALFQQLARNGQPHPLGRAHQ